MGWQGTFVLPFYGWLISHCTEVPHFIYPSSIDGHLSVVNNAAVDIRVHVFV